MSNKVIYNTPASENKPNQKNVDLIEWNYVCTFGSCFVYANGDRRRLINTETGEIIIEYTIRMHDAGLYTNSNKGHVKKRGRNVRL